jgi:chemotaxis response regulator CheB
MERKFGPCALIAADSPPLPEARKSKCEFQLIGMGADRRTLVRQAHAPKPEVVRPDMSMPLLNGLVAGERIKADQC